MQKVFNDGNEYDESSVAKKTSDKEDSAQPNTMSTSKGP